MKITDFMKKDRKAARLFASGIVMLVAGFIVLSRVDSMADNFAGFLAPLMLLSAWIIIAVSLWKIED